MSIFHSKLKKAKKAIKKIACKNKIVIFAKLTFTYLIIIKSLLLNYS